MDRDAAAVSAQSTDKSSRRSLVVSVPSDPGLLESLGTRDGVEWVTWDLESEPPRASIDLVIAPYLKSPDQLSKLHGVDVRLVQWQSIGFDGVAEALPSGIACANATSVHETSTAELALALTLASQRGIPRFVRDALEHCWETRFEPSLADRSVLIVGYGGIGKAIESRLRPFEVGIERIARTARNDVALDGTEATVHGVDELEALLSTAEIVILALPLDGHTRKLFDAAMLSTMRDDALLVNVSRGGVVDTDALVAELQTGRLRAALDVTDPEPLPADHPLWDCENLLLSPHVGGPSSAMLPRVTALIHRQIDHLQRDETPENIVIGSWP